MFPEERSFGVDQIHVLVYGEEEGFHSSKPPLKTYLSINEEPSGGYPPLAHLLPELHYQTSFETNRTRSSSTSDSTSDFHSFSTDSRSSSSFIQTRSRSSTVATGNSSTSGRIAPIPIPRQNTFVDELLPTAANPVSKSNQPMTQDTMYPAPWAEKKKDRWWSRMKWWGKKREIGFEARYDIWVNRRRAARGVY